MKLTREAFGPHLRTTRERAGISLDAIAQKTKINKSLLAGLERNDLSHWPSGIFRRSFFRGYLAALGLDSESLVADFARLFPESGQPPAEEAFLPPGGEDELRLTLTESPTASKERKLRLIAVSVADFSVVLGLGFGLAAVAPVPALAAVTASAIAYSALGIAALGETPATWLLSRKRSRRAAHDALLASRTAAAPAQLRLVSRQPDQPRAAEAEPSVAGHREPRLAEQRRLVR